MPIGLIFWIMMLFWLLHLVAWNRGWGSLGENGPFVNGVFLFILLFLLGWGEFGFAIHR